MQLRFEPRLDRTAHHDKWGHVLAGPNLLRSADADAPADTAGGCKACRLATNGAVKAILEERPYEVQYMALQHYQTLMAGWNRQQSFLRVRCPRRHPLAIPNLVAIWQSKGVRTCLACNLAAGGRLRLRDRGETAPPLQEIADQNYRRLIREAREYWNLQRLAGD